MSPLSLPPRVSIALPSLSSQVTSGKNEVTLEFHQSEEASQSLVEMRFHIPTSAQADPEEDQAKVDTTLPP